MKKKLLAGTAIGLALILVGCGSLNSNSPTGNGAQSGSSFVDDGCTHITIATSSEKVNLMDELAEVFRSSPEHASLGTCATIKPINVASGEGARLLSASSTEWPLADPELWPSLWSPASTIWTSRVDAAGGAGTIVDAQSFTHTPVVFGMPESMAKALNYPQTPISLTDIEALISDPEGWGSVGKPLWGSFKISKTNPNTSTTGLSVILMQSYEASGKVEGLTPEDVLSAEDFSRAFELGAIHYGDTTGKILSTLYNESLAGSTGSGYVSAIAVEETSLINYNMGNADSHTLAPGEVLTPPKEKLVAIYPEGGSMWSDNPVTVLGTSWVDPEKKAAAMAFAKFLQTKPAQEVLPKYGFRPLDETVALGELFTSTYGVDPARPSVSLPQPDVNTVSAAIDQWTEIRKPSAVIELIDISGSMNDGIGDGRTKLDGAIEGVIDTIDHFRRTDYVGVWAFTTEISSKLGESVVPVREFSPLGSDKETLRQDVNDLRYANMQGTPLYDAIAVAYDYMANVAEEGRINAIVVLSDGDDATSRMSLDSLLAKISTTNSETKNHAPVRIFTIAYGGGANTDVLKRISTATGGQMFDATDATKIDSVFAGVINNF